MSTLSSHLGLIVPSTPDDFTTAGLDTNWNLLDASPGIYTNTTANITTAVSTWGSAQTGMQVQQTDGQMLRYVWNGTALVRSGPLGQISSVEATSNVNVTSNVSPATIITTTCTIPAGGRSVEIKVFLPSVSNPSATTIFTLLDGGTQLQEITVPLGPSPGFGYLYACYGPSAGSHTYTVEAETGASSTTSVVGGAAGQPILMTVVEI